ncbi:MAG TPA: phage holin family protein [Gemmatirosa sp.]
MATRPAVVIDPEAGIPDLIRRLVDDSKRLAQDEVQLARLEIRERAHDATRGGIWLGIAFGAGVVALIALTVFLAALIGRALNFHYWAGTLITAVLELGIGAFLVMRGLATLKKQSFTLPETRKEASATAKWAKSTGAAVAADVRDPERVLTGEPGGAVAAAVGAGRSDGVSRADGTRGRLEIPIARRD